MHRPFGDQNRITTMQFIDPAEHTSGAREESHQPRLSGALSTLHSKTSPYSETFPHVEFFILDHRILSIATSFAAPRPQVTLMFLISQSTRHCLQPTMPTRSYNASLSDRLDSSAVGQRIIASSSAIGKFY